MKTELSIKDMIKIIVCLSLLAAGTFAFLFVQAKFFGTRPENKQPGNISAENDIVKSSAGSLLSAIVSSAAGDAGGDPSGADTVRTIVDAVASGIPSPQKLSETISILEEMRNEKRPADMKSSQYISSVLLPGCNALANIYAGKYGDAYKDVRKYDGICKDILQHKGDLIKSAMASSNGKQVMDDSQLLLNDSLGIKDVPQAVTLLKKAFALGEVNAAVVLADIYLGRQGESKVDPDKAFLWAQKAAEGAPLMGKMQLAISYLYGYGTEPDREKAVVLFKEAAALGNRDADLKLKSLLKSASE